MDEEELNPSEAARDRRRDRDAEAHARGGMQTGLAKQFKQVLDQQARRAEEAERELAADRAAMEERRGRSKGKGGKPGRKKA